MPELINQVKRLLPFGLVGWIPGQGWAENDDQRPTAAPSPSRADISNGVRWSDIVADIESQRVYGHRRR